MSHRCHWKANEVGAPLHVPSSAVSSSPTRAVPEIVGRDVFRGAPPPVTRAVASERALAAPSAFTAVTRTRIVWPTSSAASRYVRSVAPRTAAQPLVLIRRRVVLPGAVRGGQRLALAGRAADRRRR